MEGYDGANQNLHRMVSLSADVITIGVENGHLRTEGSVRYVWRHLLARAISWASGTRDAPQAHKFREDAFGSISNHVFINCYKEDQA